MNRTLFNSLHENTTPLMVLAGLLYSSWPLGYWLNPQVDRGLASNLEALHQPYNWVFISMDILSGIFAGIACRKLLTTVKRSSSQKTLLGLSVAIWGTATFALFTAIDAIVPLDCVEGSPNCPVSLHNPHLVFHGLFSVGSIGGLTVSIFAIWLLLFVREDAVRSLAHLTPATFLLVWLGFGIFTLYLVLHNQTSQLAQHLFISFCSLWLIILPYFVRLATNLQPVNHS